MHSDRLLWGLIKANDLLHPFLIFSSHTTLPFSVMNSNVFKLSAVLQYHKWRQSLQPPTIIYIACNCVLKLKISLQSSNSEQQSGAVTLNNFRHACNESIRNLCVKKISLVKTHTQDSQVLSLGYIHQPRRFEIQLSRAFNLPNMNFKYNHSLYPPRIILKSVTGIRRNLEETAYPS